MINKKEPRGSSETFLKKLERESSINSAELLKGSFLSEKTSEKNMILGLIGALAEIAEESTKHNFIKDKNLLNDYLIVNNLKQICLRKVPNLSNLLNWIYLEILNKANKIEEKIKLKEINSTKDCFVYLYKSEEFSDLYKNIKIKLNEFIDYQYDELINSLPEEIFILEDYSAFNFLKNEESDFFKIKLIKEKILKIKEIEHLFIEWLFDEEIKNLIIKNIKLKFDLLDLIKLKKEKLLNF